VLVRVSEADERQMIAHEYFWHGELFVWRGIVFVYVVEIARVFIGNEIWHHRRYGYVFKRKKSSTKRIDYKKNEKKKNNTLAYVVPSPLLADEKRMLLYFIGAIAAETLVSVQRVKCKYSKRVK
jgi:hypothetical protein